MNDASPEYLGAGTQTLEIRGGANLIDRVGH